MKQVLWRFLASLLCSTGAIYLVGNSAPRCVDCMRREGWPLAYYHDAGFVGDAGWVWTGLLADSAVVLLLAFAATFVWSALAQGLRRKVDEDA